MTLHFSSNSLSMSQVFKTKNPLHSTVRATGMLSQSLKMTHCVQAEAKSAEASQVTGGENILNRLSSPLQGCNHISIQNIFGYVTKWLPSCQNLSSLT